MLLFFFLSFMELQYGAISTKLGYMHVRCQCILLLLLPQTGRRYSLYLLLYAGTSDTAYAAILHRPDIRKVIALAELYTIQYI